MEKRRALVIEPGPPGWLDDPREITGAMLLSGESFSLGVGDSFERIEKVGQRATVPWLWIATNHRDGVSVRNRRVIEVPLEALQWIEYAQ